MSGHGGESGRWMVSYADFVTLLFVLFVVLYSMGQTDVKRYKELADSFKAAFTTGKGGGGPARVVSPAIDSGGGLSTSDGAPAPISIEGLPKQSMAGIEVANDLVKLLNDSNLSSDVSIQNNVEGILIALSEKLLFSPGTVELQQEGYAVMDNAAEMLRPLQNEIRVVGYTDNTPPLDPSYQNNWDLSVARAKFIVEYLVGKGIDPQRLSVSGKGENAPIFENDTIEHRAINNRVEIVVIYPQKVENIIEFNISGGQNSAP
jgi:chemotaxis protein MotB